MITLKEKIGYGLGDIASFMFWRLFDFYLMIFYTDMFGLPAAVVGTTLLITRVWDSTFDPIVGVTADHTQIRWGKPRPYLLYLVIPFAPIGISILTTSQLSETGKLVYAYVTYSLMMMVYSAINVSYASLPGVMSSGPKERNTLFTYRMTFAYIGSFIASLLFMPMTNLFGGAEDEQRDWMLSIVVIVVMRVALFHLCFALTREQVKPTREVQGSLKDDLRGLLYNRLWWILLGAGVAVLIFDSIRDGATVYYFKYSVIEEDYSTVLLFGVSFVLSGLYLAVGQAANIVGVVLVVSVSNRTGKKNTYMGAMSLATILSVIFYWFGEGDIALTFVFQVFISICAGSIFLLLWPVYTDYTDYFELKTGNRATGLIFSSSSMSQKFGWAIESALTGWLLTHLGLHVSGVQSVEAIHGTKMLLSWLSAVGTVSSAIFTSTYPLSERRMREMTSELEKKRQTAQL